MAQDGMVIRPAQRHDEEFYEAAEKRRQEAIARGEDPYADFKKLVAERGHNSAFEILWRKLTRKGKTKTGEPAATGSRGRAEYAELGKFGNGEAEDEQRQGSIVSQGGGARKNVRKRLFGKSTEEDVVR
ncbi:MAG: hypothetical protein MMC23_009059 [Stictis urceolatum]|nr:hypothetical protein [Stictis urceolata]